MIYGRPKEGLQMKTEILSESLEDYLEAIHHIVRAKGAARGKDISERLKVNRSSVTGALRALAGKKLVNYAPYDLVTLTQEGGRVAERIIHRHEVLKDFIHRVLGMEERMAEQDACRMEHAASQAVLDRLAQFIDFIRVCPRIDIHWIEQTGYFCHRPGTREDCERCLRESLRRLGERRGSNGNASH
jgi:DtxR family Mn-dependent transcriptional regulator